MRNILCAVFIFLLIGACRPNNEETRSVGVRIISLSPGITNTLIDAGYEDLLVGRSAFCKQANQKVPVVGDLRSVDYERLLSLSPTFVFVQQTVSGVDPHLLKLAHDGVFALRSWPIDRLADIQQLYGDVTELIGEKRLPLEVVTPKEHALPSPLLVITQGMEGSAGLCFGKDTYIDDLLQAIGVENLVQHSGWISLSLEDIGRLEPEAILVVSDIEINKNSSAGIRSLGFPVIPFVHEHVLIPSSSIVEVAQELQKVRLEP